MAEHFHGKFRSLHTTSGGGELFLRSLVAVGESSAGTDVAAKKLLGFIRERLAKGNGWFHITAYPLPEEIDGLPSLLFFASTTERLVQALIDNDMPAPLVKEFDCRDLRLHWVAFAIEFYELIRESANFSLPQISPPSFEDDEASSIVSINRLRLRLADAKRNHNYQEQLALLTEVIALETRLKEPAGLWSNYLQKAELELTLGDTPSAIESLLKGAVHAKGADSAFLLQLAADLQSPT